MSEEVRLEKWCDWCGRQMVLRRNRRDDSQFWGCSGYPECTRTADPPAYLEELSKGAQQLPGF